MLLRRYPLALLVGLLLLMISSPTTAQDPDDVLQRIQTTYDEAEALRASFTQEIGSPFADRPTTNRGTVWMQDQKFRIETADQTLVADGTTTWIYRASTNQVIINDYVNDETTLTPDEIFYDYAERFVVRSMDSERHDGDRYFVLHLTPRSDDTTYQSVTLHVRDRDTAITRLQLEDRDDTTITFTFDHIQFNPDIDANQFTFEPPPEAEVVDLRS